MTIDEPPMSRPRPAPTPRPSSGMLVGGREDEPSHAGAVLLLLLVISAVGIGFVAGMSWAHESARLEQAADLERRGER